MTSANAVRLAALLLQLSDRHPIPALAGSDLEDVEPRLLRSLRARGILVERAELGDTGDTVICADPEGGLVEVDPETGEVVRIEDPQSLRHHDIDLAALCREIRTQSGLTGPGPIEIASRIWRLGRHAAEARAAEVCLLRGFRANRVQEVLDRVRGTIWADVPVILVSLSGCDLPPSALRQIEGARCAVRRGQGQLGPRPAQGAQKPRPRAIDMEAAAMYRSRSPRAVHRPPRCPSAGRRRRRASRDRRPARAAPRPERGPRCRRPHRPPRRPAARQAAPGSAAAVRAEARRAMGRAVRAAPAARPPPRPPARATGRAPRAPRPRRCASRGAEGPAPQWS